MYFSLHIYLNLNAVLLAPGLFDYPDRELCWIPFLSSCLTSVSRLPCRILREVISVPLPYADDFGCFSPI